MNKFFINNWYSILTYLSMQYLFLMYSDDRWHNYHMTYIMITKNTSTGVSPLATVELGAIIYSLYGGECGSDLHGPVEYNTL